MEDRTDHSGPAVQPGDGWSADGHGYLQDNIRQRVFVVHPYLSDSYSSVRLVRSPEARLEEAMGLAEAIDVEIVGGECIPLRAIKPKTFLGEGKLLELKQFTEDQEIDLVVFDCELSPGQQRNLERTLKVKVIDRTALILEIFGARASTKEGELQVELAHLTYQKSRLVRSWTHLERQRGGSGFMGGPGETQIESDRRIISDRISRIRKQLESVTRTRTLHRARRQKTPYSVIALVGYTNAGKSTLFNQLTKADVLAEDMLFATLDPTLRAIELPSTRKVILSDTVGFISELPTMLVAAFRATLEEVLEADIILHVRDAAHKDSEVQKQDVLEVLAELGIDINQEDDGAPILDVYNKIDMVPEERADTLRGIASRTERSVVLSGLTGEGCDTLIKTIDTLLGEQDYRGEITVSYSDGSKQAWLHANTKILEEKHMEDGIYYRFSVDPVVWSKYSKHNI
ncbi:GTPase HflX [Kordiimonas pumila]|uniref:GTPase HflX n=1 Tax=Kordiimonas pumila TaxID=2161677 RepID=A0ABV7D2L2_9PROT|nr:GTPase HflX [Kordiimonas pumila]